MKNRTLLTIALFLTAVMLFFVILGNGRETLTQQTILASVQMDTKPLTPQEVVMAVDDEMLLPQTPVALKYKRYPMSYVYFAVFSESIPVYSSPNSDKQVIRMAEQREKLNYLETVTLEEPGSGPKTWYHVYWYVDEKGALLADGSAMGAEKCFGFITSEGVAKRRFRLDLMAEYVQKAAAFAAEGSIAHISNYKNGNGLPPAYEGKDLDAAGNRRSQSAPGYPSLPAGQQFTYLADGTLVRVLEESAGDGKYRKVLCFADDKMYYVPLKYLSDPHTLTELKKIVVIDRKNQNEAAFEKLSDEAGQTHWTVVSCSLATTGTESKYAVPTPLGYYQMIEKRTQFYYYKDGTTEISGYAPFVMRFCGGAYIHGVPVTYQYKNGKRITPPHIEYSATMGTVPLSHKCVRNYTSHAEFLWNWFEEGKTAVVVME